MRAIPIALLLALSATTTAVAGAVPFLRSDGPVQARHLALDVPRGFDWVELWPCGWQDGTGEIRHFVVQERLRGRRPYAPPVLIIDVIRRVADTAIDAAAEAAWDQAFAAADEDLAGRLAIDEHSRWRTGTMKNDGAWMRVGLLLKVIDGDAYWIQVIAPAHDERAWHALVAAAKSSRREVPTPSTTRPDPFCSER